MKSIYTGTFNTLSFKKEWSIVLIQLYITLQFIFLIFMKVNFNNLFKYAIFNKLLYMDKICNK